MKHITFYLDFISPYAYLAFEALPEALIGHSCTVTYRPILFAALLKHHGQLGPAEIPGKREWTYRQVQWLANQQAIELQMPLAHPFNPLGLLRLAVACGLREHQFELTGEVSSPCDYPNRHVCEALFRHVWRGGADAADARRLADIAAKLVPAVAPGSDIARAQLKANTDEAVARGVFGVPTCEVDGKLFWGLDALPMLRGYLDGDAWFQDDLWDRAATLPVAATRRR